MKTKRYLLSLLLVLALLALPTAVFAKELGRLNISGPGIDGEKILDHQGGMSKLEGSGFFDRPASVKPPQNLGAGYNITAYLNLDGKVVPFVQMVYYATENDQPGYVHYTGRLKGESLQPVDEWGQLNKDADAAFRGLMAEYDITLVPAIVSAAELANVAANTDSQVAQVPVEAAAPQTQPEVQPAASLPAPTQSSFPMLVLTTALMLILVSALILRRRAISQRSVS